MYEYKSKIPYVETNYEHGKITHDASSTMTLSRNADKVLRVCCAKINDQPSPGDSQLKLSLASHTGFTCHCCSP